MRRVAALLLIALCALTVAVMFGMAAGNCEDDR